MMMVVLVINVQLAHRWGTDWFQITIHFHHSQPTHNDSNSVEHPPEQPHLFFSGCWGRFHVIIMCGHFTGQHRTLTAHSRTHEGSSRVGFCAGRFQCVGEETVHGLGRLEDEHAHLGLFDR